MSGSGANDSEASAKITMIKRLTVTVHTRERTVVRPLSAASLVRCEACAAEVLAKNAESAASLLRVTTTVVRRLIDGGTLHVTNICHPAWLICANSLSRLTTYQEQED